MAVRICPKCKAFSLESTWGGKSKYLCLTCGAKYESSSQIMNDYRKHKVAPGLKFVIDFKNGLTTCSCSICFRNSALGSIESYPVLIGNDEVMNAELIANDYARHLKDKHKIDVDVQALTNQIGGTT